MGLIADPFDVKAIVKQVGEWDEGHVVDTLGPACNERASNWGYVKEYRRWFDLFVAETKGRAAKTGVDPLRDTTQPFVIELPYDVHPARFVRQVLGMFLAVQEAEHPTAVSRAARSRGQVGSPQTASERYPADRSC